MNSEQVIPWRRQDDDAAIPAEAKTVDAIMPFARQLTRREARQLVDAFEAGSYEIGASFIWMKSMISLKNQLSALGVEFVGEMLDRPSIGPHTSIIHSISDYDAIRLSEELGAFSGRQAMRLRHALDVITHVPDGDDHDEPMAPEEAIGLVRACVQSILSQDKIAGAFEFVEFRRQLEEKTFNESDQAINDLLNAEYFFKRTTIRILLALLKTNEGAKLQHILENVNIFIPALWGQLLDSDKWLIGRSYAEVHAAGKSTASIKLRKTLLQVKGFDFVPENLRSNTYIHVAKRIMDTHFASNNFYNEPAEVRNLISLGTVIPMPALAQCMTALLCVRLGNSYGVSWDASSLATSLLSDLTQDQWRYFLDECLPGDSTVLEKLQHGRTVDTWCDLVAEQRLTEMGSKRRDITRLLTASAEHESAVVKKIAAALYRSVGPGD